MQNVAKTYFATQVETTSQGELVVMLFEAAIKFLKQAKVEIEARNFAKKGILITKAMNIVHELSESLNTEKGGDLANNLSGIYHFCTMRLVKANLEMSTTMVDEVVAILDGLKGAFAQIVPQAQAGAKAAPGAQPPAQAQPPKAPQTLAAPLTYAQPAAPRAAAGIDQAAEPAIPVNSARLRAANAYLNTR